MAGAEEARSSHAEHHAKPASGPTAHHYPVPEVRLVERSGEEMTLAAALGEEGPVLLQFIFTTCTTICPVQSALLGQVGEGLGEHREQVRMVSVTVDPEHDTPARMADYARRLEAPRDWLFLTGGAAQIEAAQKAFGVYRANKMWHEAQTFLRPEPGSPWLRFDGFAAVDELVARVLAALP